MVHWNLSLGSSANLPPEIQVAAIGLNETPFKISDEHLALMRALSKTVKLRKCFFPRCSNMLDKIRDEEQEPELASLGSTERKRRFHDLQDALLRAFSVDNDEFRSSA
uniref:NPR1/NIM1-like C-terminal domain-containing protein n=1 Tax=Triticum urartu TaxID=4572 RepID=A0A8R7QTX0_TRIUA